MNASSSAGTAVYFKFKFRTCGKIQPIKIGHNSNIIYFTVQEYVAVCQSVILYCKYCQKKVSKQHGCILLCLWRIYSRQRLTQNNWKGREIVWFAKHAKSSLCIGIVAHQALSRSVYQWYGGSQQIDIHLPFDD